MCIPPINVESSNFFKDMHLLNTELSLTELSMGMSSDYKSATKNLATFLRIGSNIFGKRF